jgi:tetratricopeptide (TPR) repeat protein
VSSASVDPRQLELEQAQALVGLHRFDAAASLLQELLGTEPDIAPAWCLLAQAQLGLAQPKEALGSAERAATLAPDNDWPHRLRSVALMQLGDANGAIAAAREAVAKGPHNWQTHNRLALVLGDAKRDLDEALAAAERAVSLAPNEANAHFALGMVNHTRKNHAEAERCFRRALALDPQHSPSLTALAGQRLVKRRSWRPGNLADAASGLRDAVEVDPRSDYSARSLDLVLRAFFGRVSYLIFLTVYVASRVKGSNLTDRIAPLLLLAIPAAFAVRFLAGLTPTLRRRVGYMALRGALGLAVIAQLCAIALLFVAALAPAGSRTGMLAAAAIVSLAARVSLWVTSRRLRRHRG